MTTIKQIKANQENGKKGGIKTEQGKLASRYNARKHGLLSQETLLPTENENELMSLLEEVARELSPTGKLEEFWVDRIVSNIWRLKRLHAIETGAFNWEYFTALENRSREKAYSYQRRESLYPLLEVEKITIENKEEYDKAISEADAYNESKYSNGAILGRVFVSNEDESDTVSKLLRYERSLERSLIRATHELQNLQTWRNKTSLTKEE